MDDDFKRNERPTFPNTRDVYLRQGMMMADIQEIKRAINDMEGRILVLEDQNQVVIPRMRQSMRAPHVQSGGIAFAVSSSIVAIFETLRAFHLIH